MAWILSVAVPHQPGQLAAVAEALAGAGINIDSVSGSGQDARGMLHVLVNDAEQAKSVLESAGFTVTASRRALTASVENSLGVLARCARRLADDGINVEAIFLGADNQLVCVVADPAAAESAWEEATAAPR